MSRIIALFLYVGVLLALPSAVAAREVELLERVGAWQVDFADTACHLVGTFGEGDKQIVAVFTRFQPHDDFALIILGKRFRSARTQRFNAIVDFGVGAPNDVSGFYGKQGGDAALVFNPMALFGRKRGEPSPSWPSTTSPSDEARVSAVTMTVKGARPFKLHVGSLSKPFEMLRRCTSELVRRWGYDPEVQAKLSRQAEPAEAVQNWINHDDFPIEALAAGESGLVDFRLDVEADGSVKSCHILSQSKSQIFAKKTCDLLMERARFKPALDFHGAAIRSYFVKRVNWISYRH